MKYCRTANISMQILLDSQEFPSWIHHAPFQKQKVCCPNSGKFTAQKCPVLQQLFTSISLQFVDSPLSKSFPKFTHKNLHSFSAWTSNALGNIHWKPNSMQPVPQYSNWPKWIRISVLSCVKIILDRFQYMYGRFNQFYRT